MASCHSSWWRIASSSTSKLAWVKEKEKDWKLLRGYRGLQDGRAPSYLDDDLKQKFSKHSPTCTSKAERAVPQRYHISRTSIAGPHHSNQDYLPQCKLTLWQGCASAFVIYYAVWLLLLVVALVVHHNIRLQRGAHPSAKGVGQGSTKIPSASGPKQIWNLSAESLGGPWSRRKLCFPKSSSLEVVNLPERWASSWVYRLPILNFLRFPFFMVQLCTIPENQ